jgi:hypothetical protein
MLLLLSLLACDPPADPCAQMCAQAAAVQCGCLETWDGEWSDLGYTDQEDFYESCQTWAWEMRILERDAVQRGEIDEAGQVDAVCEERTAQLSTSGFSCKEWRGMDWSVTPWD